MTQVPDTLLRDFLHYDRRTVPPVVEQWIPEEHIRLLLEREMERNVARMTDTDFAESSYSRRPVPGAVAGDYNHRLLSLENGRHVLAVIRFRRLGLQELYVDILHRDFPVESPEQAQALAREVVSHYEVFSPDRIRMFDGTGMFDADMRSSAVGHFRYYAAPVQVLRQLPLPPRFSEVALELLTNLDFYDAYVDMYRRLHTECPHLQFVPVEPPEVLAQCMAEGKLFRIVIDGQFAGVAGVVPQAERFVEGYLIAEEILDSPFRRQGFAPALQRRLLEEIACDDLQVLYGHISPENTASLRTAARVGRSDIGGMYFVHTDEERLSL